MKNRRDVRRQAIDAFLGALHANNIPPGRDNAFVVMREIADRMVPVSNDVLLEYHSFYHEAVSHDQLPQNVTIFDVLRIAFYEYLMDEMTEALKDEIEKGRDDARNLIEQVFAGFTTDSQKRHWCCVEHAIDVLFERNYQPLLDLAKGDVENVQTPDGYVIYALRLGETLPEDTFCGVSNCPQPVYVTDPE